MAVGLVIGGWFASAFIGKLSDRLRKYIEDQDDYQKADTKGKLESLEGSMMKIQAAVYAADQRQIENPGLKNWVLDLKDACYDAEDVLDLFEYEQLKKRAKAMKQTRSISAKAQKLSKHASTIAKRSLFRDGNLNQLLDIEDRFVKLVKQMQGFLHLLGLDSANRGKGESNEIMEWRSTYSDFKEPQLFGRPKERTHLIDELMDKGENEDVSCQKVVDVLCIVGIGGVGKTALVQSVYNEECIRKSFDLIAWVCVSNRFELKRLMVEIIESASIMKPPDFYSIRSLDKIQQILKSGLAGKRFLIVLDDVWDEARDKWETLRSALESGKEGSKVIVTTRNHKIADIMRTTEVQILGTLADNDYWDFFVQCAFGDEKPQNRLNLEHFGRKIVKKLGGLPLAAKVVGAVLKSNMKEQHWKEISESELWEIDQREDGILPVLRLSYEYLPAHLKQCFVYCSLFPQDYRFSKKRLIRFWMAQGFIQPKLGKRPELIGKAYFNELVSRSFFQQSGYKEYVIHDLLHDLAQYLSDGETFRADDKLSEIKPEEIPKRVRHAYISSNNLPFFCENKNAKKHLRSLVVVGHCDVSLGILAELKGLRMLALEHLDEKITSESLRHMLHLRHLEIFGKRSPNYVLPECLFKLYHLQLLSIGARIFDLAEGDHYCILPRGTNRLINLRHLVAYTGRTPGIGASSCLQALRFCVNQKENGFDMRQLDGMLQLRRLCIEGLESVESKEQASEAKLCDKKELKELTLKWGWESHGVDPEGVFEGLQLPQENLEHFEIVRYNGRQPPSWWNGNWVSYLHCIKLSDGSNWEILPPMGQLPFLKDLELYNMNAVKSIDSEFYGNSSAAVSFPSLERLYINGMFELEKWCSRVEGIESLFPRLSSLSVFRCPKLRGPLCLPSPLTGLLVKIEEDCTAIAIRKGAYVSISCPSVSRLKEWIPRQNLAMVETLEITDGEMTAFPTDHADEWFQSFSSLKSLCFDWCSKLQTLPSLRLHRLTLRQCYGIHSLPEEWLPDSLKELNIDGCSNELEERCRRDGVDWHKISHIPTIIMNYKEVQKLAEDQGDNAEHAQNSIPTHVSWAPSRLVNYVICFFAGFSLFLLYVFLSMY